MTMTAAELVASKKHILLDFDGPICAAFAGYGATKISRELFGFLPAKVRKRYPQLATSADPFDFLRYIAKFNDDLLMAELNREFRRLEVEAVRAATPTPYADATIRQLTRVGHEVAVVSNNSEQAVYVYLLARNLSDQVIIFGRTAGNPELLKPNPHLLLLALQHTNSGPEEAVMVGDSPSDIQAAHCCGISSIAFINKAIKLRTLEAARPSHSISRMDELLPDGKRSMLDSR